MKTLREELFDFLKWYRAEWSIPEYKKDEYSVDDYLFEKSNNSSTSDDDGGMISCRIRNHKIINYADRL